MQLSEIWRELWRYIYRMDTQEWLIALAAVVVIGLFCLRGFGSRSEF